MKPHWPREKKVERTIHGTLEKCATSVEQVARGRWVCVFANGAEVCVGATVADDWLLLDAPFEAHLAPLIQGAAGADRGSYLRAADLLRRNATLAGGVKFAVLSQAPQTRLRAEVPLDEEVDVVRRVRQACAGLKAAAAGGASTAHTAPADCYPVSTVDTAGDDGSPFDLRCLCSATRWPFIERDASSVAVDLEVPAGFRQALVEVTDGGGVVVSVDLATCAELASPPCQAAWGLLLLRACGVVRMARAAAHTRDGGAATPRFEVVFPDAPAAAELAHAFATLSVACRLVDREARVLAHDAAIATEYLRQWNGNDGALNPADGRILTARGAERREDQRWDRL